MGQHNRTKRVAWVAMSLSTCFVASCATGFRDAVMIGVFDFTSATVTDTLGTFVSVSDLFGGDAAEE